jgi:cobalamin biosynthesis protein CbiG
VPAREILAHAQSTFAQNGLAPQSVAAVGTAEIKRDDPGICQAMQVLGPECVFFTAQALADVESAGQSEAVRARVGSGSVCEAAALLLCGGGPLVAAKTKTTRATCAVALRPADARKGD